MEMIARPLAIQPEGLQTIRIPVERLQLAKRRWRGIAEDGREFGFDLERALEDGAPVFESETAVYVVAQKYEPVLEIDLGNAPTIAARLGWMIGNLHFAIEVSDEKIRVADDPALRQLFERERLEFLATKRVFRPIQGGHQHSHAHH